MGFSGPFIPPPPDQGGYMKQSYDPNGTSRSVTSLPGASGGNAELMDLFRQQARRNMEQSAYRAPQPGRVMARNDPAPGVSAPAPAHEHQRTQLEALRESAEIEKLQAMMRPAPQRMTTFASGTNGYVDDPTKMSGIQRDIFLPANAQQVGPAGPSPAGLTPGNASTPQATGGSQQDVTFQDYMAQQALKGSNADIEARRRALAGMLPQGNGLSRGQYGG